MLRFTFSSSYSLLLPSGTLATGLEAPRRIPVSHVSSLFPQYRHLPVAGNIVLVRSLALAMPLPSLLCLTLLSLRLLEPNSGCGCVPFSLHTVLLSGDRGSVSANRPLQWHTRSESTRGLPRRLYSFLTIAEPHCFSPSFPMVRVLTSLRD